MNPAAVVKSIELRAATVEIWSNGIVYYKLKDNLEIQLEDAKAQYEFLKAAYDGKTKFRVLVEPGRYTSITAEAREFSALPEINNMTAASAVIVKTLAHKLLMNFLINFTRKQTIKMRMFDSKERAVEWLLSVKV